MVCPRTSPQCSFNCLLSISRLAWRDSCLPPHMHCTCSNVPNPWRSLFIAFSSVLLSRSRCCIVLSDHPLLKTHHNKNISGYFPRAKGNPEKKAFRVSCVRKYFGVPMVEILRNPTTCGVLLERVWPDLHTISQCLMHSFRTPSLSFHQSKHSPLNY